MAGAAQTPAPRRSSAVDRVRTGVHEKAAHLSRRARRLLSRQLRKARASDSALLQHAYVAGRQGVRRALNLVTDRQVGWVATLWSARWLEGTTYEITGWAYERGYGHPAPPRVEVQLRRRGTAVALRADVEPVTEMEVNGLVRRAEFDYANTGFVARLDLAPLLRHGPGPGDDEDDVWEVHVRVTVGGLPGRPHRRRRRPAAPPLGRGPGPVRAPGHPGGHGDHGPGRRDVGAGTDLPARGERRPRGARVPRCPPPHGRPAGRR
ncbi:MAG: hypothetical protein DI571_12275 [Arsenicicoccus sp.]|nr:MAG: hypothetical protein DI571_12275 [Arsenicicoccus sp.]